MLNTNGYIGSHFILLPVIVVDSKIQLCDRSMLIKEFLPVPAWVAEAVMLQLLCGLQINSMDVLPPKRNFKNGLVKSVRIFPSFFHMEQLIVLVEVR